MKNYLSVNITRRAAIVGLPICVLLTVLLIIIQGCSKDSLKNAVAVQGTPVLKLNSDPVYIAPTNSNIEYIGRWDKSVTTNYHSYWGGAYFRVNFTGISVDLKLASTAVDTYYWIDGKKDSIIGAHDSVRLNHTALTAGTHTLQVAAKYQSDELQLKNIVLTTGSTTLPPALRADIIEFIGNSIISGDRTFTTAAKTYKVGNTAAFPWLIGESLNANHTQISFPGITLTDPYHYTYAGAPLHGQSAQYFWMKEPNKTPNPNWFFSNYTPKIVAIDLGTNDAAASLTDGAGGTGPVSTSLFQNTYTTFLSNIRTKFPSAEICVLRQFNLGYTTQTVNAVNARITAGDTHIHYIDTNGWLVAADYDDGTHPTIAGHKKIAQHLAPILSVYLNHSAIINPGFEVDAATSTPTGWSTSGANPEADYTEGGSTHGGSFRLSHYKSTAYVVNTFQTLTGLANGTYTLKAWAIGGSGHNANYIFAKNYGGADKQQNLPVTSGTGWTQITIANIVVTNGQCQIGYYTDGNAGNWGAIDDVELILQ